MLVGEIPCDDQRLSAVQILVRRLKEGLPDVRTEAPDVSGRTAQVIRWMTKRDREHRYPSPALVVRDIDLIQAGRDPLGPSDGALPDGETPNTPATRVMPTAATSTSRTRLPSSWVLGCVLLGLATLAAGAAFAAFFLYWEA